MFGIAIARAGNVKKKVLLLVLAVPIVPLALEVEVDALCTLSKQRSRSITHSFWSWHGGGSCSRVCVHNVLSNSTYGLENWPQRKTCQTHFRRVAQCVCVHNTCAALCGFLVDRVAWRMWVVLVVHLPGAFWVLPLALKPQDR